MLESGFPASFTVDEKFEGGSQENEPEEEAESIENPGIDSCDEFSED